MYEADRSSGWRHRPGDWWATQFMSKALKRMMRVTDPMLAVAPPSVTVSGHRDPKETVGDDLPGDVCQRQILG
ncbi:hypothetical protein GCM10023114_41520 [Mycolicibacterium sediminis]